MGSPLLALASVVFFGFYASIIESQGNLNLPSPKFTSPGPPLLPPPPPPPPTPVWPTPSHPPPPPPPHHPPPRKDLRPPPQDHGLHSRPQLQYHRHGNSDRLKKEKLNVGKKVGLMFVGVTAILQVCVAVFLVVRRRQLFKTGNV